MNENMFQNLIFLGIMSEALAKRNCIKMKMTPAEAKEVLTKLVDTHTVRTIALTGDC